MQVGGAVFGQFIRQQWRMWIETPPPRPHRAPAQEFIRQQWRMWIETAVHRLLPVRRQNSFASNGECGLKRAWRTHMAWSQTNSFASNGECGLKRRNGACHGDRHRQFIRQQWRMWIETGACTVCRPCQGNSFASNGECGLKPVEQNLVAQLDQIHSPAMANVD